MTAKLSKEAAKEFGQEIQEESARSLWALNVMAVLIWPLSTPIDFFIVDEALLPALLKVRYGYWGALLVFAVIAYWLRRRDSLVRFVAPLICLHAAVVVGFIAHSAIVAGGIGSAYATAMLLAIFAYIVALPWSMSFMILFGAGMIALFNGIILIFDQNFEWFHFVVNGYLSLTMVFLGAIWIRTSYAIRVQSFLYQKQIVREKARSESLLLNILPEDVAEELKTTGRVEARSIGACSILFTDFVGFTKMSGRVQARALVDSLDKAFTRFDAIVERWGLEKLKTIGDAYMCAGGVLGEQPDHLMRCILAGLEMNHALEAEGLLSADGIPWRMRIGVHPGPVVAGVIGQSKFAYDLWGDTVNTAARLESSGQPRSINLTTAVYKQVESFFVGIDRGYIPVRGKGPLAMTRVTRLRPSYSDDPGGSAPNSLLREHMASWAASRTIHRLAGPKAVEGVPSFLEREGLRALSMLPELTAEDRELLLKHADPVSFGHGRVLVEQGQGLKMLLLLLKGTVSVRIARDDVVIEVGRLRPGEIVGELSFVSWEPASATVVAIDDVIALRLDLDWMETLMGNHPHTAARVFHSLSLVLAQRVRESNARLFTWGAERDKVRSDRSASRNVAATSVPEKLSAAVSLFHGQIQAALARQNGGEASATQGLVNQALNAFVSAVGSCSLADSKRTPAIDPSIGAYLLRETYSTFMQSSTMERIHAKPLGAAMDYLTAERIYDNEAHGHGSLGVQIDRWFLDWRIAASLRGCMKEASRLVIDSYGAWTGEQGLFRIAVLSAGSAPELFQTLTDLGKPDDVAVTCVDSDLSALSALGQQASKVGLAERFSFVCEGLLDASSSSDLRLRLLPQQLILLPVLTEAVDDPLFIHLLDEIYDNLEPGGLAALGALDLPLDATLVSEVLLDWAPAEWTNGRLRDLVSQSSFAGQEPDIHTAPKGYWSLLVLRREEC